MEPTIEEVLAEAKGGNAALREIYRRAGRTLGIGIGNIGKLFDPEKIIITGKGVLAGELLFGPMRETLPPGPFLLRVMPRSGFISRSGNQASMPGERVPWFCRRFTRARPIGLCRLFRSR